MAYDQLTLKGATSQLIEIMLRDSTTGQGKTGLAAASVTAYYIREGGSSNTSMTLDGTMTLGTWKTLGWVEVDSTHQKGLYQLGIPNAAIATGANAVTFILTASGTIDKALRLVLLDADLRDATRLGLSALPNATAGATNGLPLSVDSSGRVDVLKLNGTSQTARDIGASVLVSSGTGAGQISLSSGLVTLAGVTHTGARIPNVTPTDTVSTYTGNTVQTGDAYARLCAPAGASHAADVAAVKSDTGGLRTDYTTARGRLRHPDRQCQCRRALETRLDLGIGRSGPLRTECAALPAKQVERFLGNPHHHQGRRHHCGLDRRGDD